MPQRIDPAMDRAAAALLLGCAPDQVGYCARCQGLTQRYGRDARPVCRACQARQAAATDGTGSVRT